MKTETITAIATPPGRGGVAIVRISGPHVTFIAENILGKIPKPRLATFSQFKDGENNPIDEGIALFFPGPHSFTGEDVLELHGHGGPCVVDCLIRRILALGARLARPGEFSERAFLNDKIDLAQAEAIADLIDASSEQAVRASLRSLQGEFSKKIQTLVESLIRLRIYVEAAIDFVEEEIDFLADQQVSHDLTMMINQVESIRGSAMQGSLLRDGITAVIAGQPNVGKSSLLNCISGKDIAIVTDIPGTTRDLLREHIHLDGMPIHFIDTAGLRASSDPVEQEGIRRARDEMTRADLILCVVDARDKSHIENTLLSEITVKAPIIIIRNKIDLTQESPTIADQNGRTIISISAKNNLGIDLLKKQIKSCVGFQTDSAGIFSARRRHLDALDRAYDHLLNGQKQLSDFRAGELLAEDLRQAQLALSEITGQFTADDLLGRIFSSFCIGK
ncbi:MAG: tRNA uridine-5-carboxymethylaminomethyl(34) synthesis GTPase MnmE [Gammaproteobacteria bacterium]